MLLQMFLSENRTKNRSLDYSQINKKNHYSCYYYYLTQFILIVLNFRSLECEYLNGFLMQKNYKRCLECFFYYNGTHYALSVSPCVCVFQGRDLSSLGGLEEVVLSSCGVEGLEAGALRAQEGLRTLDLQNNKLRQLPRGLPPSLEILHLGHNRLQGLGEAALEGLRRLRLLDLQHNHLSSLRAGVLANLVRLETLLLEGNRIETVQGSLRLPQLNLVSLAHNKIPSFPSAFFSQTKSLRTLSLQGNLLTRVPPGLPHSLCLQIGRASCRERV